MATLPGQGEWHLVNPLIGANPPFAVLTVDFQRKSGRVRLLDNTQDLSTVTQMTPSKFGARYQIGRNSGLFEAEYQPDQTLRLKFIGSVRTDCKANVISITENPIPKRFYNVPRIAILTCVGNPRFTQFAYTPNGPGHTALALGNRVYSFEKFSGHSGGWEIQTVNEFLARPCMSERPIIVQELTASSIDIDAAIDYIHATVADNDTFLTSGWCSYQAASALRAGIRRGFEPSGPDTPWEVYSLAKRSGLVSRTYMIWDPSKTRDAVHVELLAKLQRDFPDAAFATGPDIRQW